MSPLRIPSGIRWNAAHSSASCQRRSAPPSSQPAHSANRLQPSHWRSALGRSKQLAHTVAVWSVYIAATSGALHSSGVPASSSRVAR